jgi:hypothetical protein
MMIEHSERIAIDPNRKRIHFSSAFRRTNHEIYLALTSLWARSPALLGDPPLWYCYQTDELGCATDWILVS